MKTCTVKDCAKPHRARGYCDGHYRRWKLGKTIDAAPLLVRASRQTRAGPCRFSGCLRPIRSQGLCCTHYRRMRQEPESFSQPIRPYSKPDAANNKLRGLYVVPAMLAAAREEMQRRGIRYLSTIIREWATVGWEAHKESLRREEFEKWEKGKWRRGA